jgi:hypothetical protein
MELLAHPKTDFLLESSLKSLHVECLEWLHNIDYWRDKLGIFYNLLLKKESVSAYPPIPLAALKRQLVSISIEELEILLKEMKRHEYFLAMMLKTPSLLEEKDYREKHRKLQKRFCEIKAQIKAFKEEFYSFIQKYE